MKRRRWPLWARVLAWGSALGVFGTMVLVAGGLVLLARAAQPPSTVVLEKDVPYRTVGGKTLKLDIVRPKAGLGPFPAILFIHGGGWQAGNKSEYLQASDRIIPWRPAPNGRRGSGPSSASFHHPRAPSSCLIASRRPAFDRPNGNAIFSNLPQGIARSRRS